MDIAQGGATAATNALQVAGVYNSSPLTLTNGQAAALQFDVNGNAKVVGQGIAQGSTTSGEAGTLISARLRQVVQAIRQVTAILLLSTPMAISKSM